MDLNQFNAAFEESEVPLYVQRCLKWPLLQWDLEKWSKTLGDRELKYRKGKNEYTTEPQWNYTTETVTGTFKDFLDHAELNKDEWLYFDYKHLGDWFQDVDEINNEIKWNIFGVPANSNQSTMWIGSKGAHTPCHKDSYGYNIVAQIYGSRKQWTLFPPEESLLSTRVPYEESSVFSKINFFSPDIQHIRKFDKCRQIVLDAGDVLLVPNGWWHYVESLDTSISINIWIPKCDDVERRYDESIIQLLSLPILQASTNDVKSKLCLSRETKENMESLSFQTALKTVESCQSELKEIKKHNMCPDKTNTIPKNDPRIQEVPNIVPADCYKFLLSQRERFNCTDDKILKSFATSFNERMMEVLTDTEVVNLIKKKLLNKAAVPGKK